MYMYDLPQLWPIFATLPDKCKKKTRVFLSKMQYQPNIRGIIIIVISWFGKIYMGGKVLTRGKDKFFEHPPFLDAFVTPWLWECFPGPAPRPWRPHLPKASRIPKDCRWVMRGTYRWRLLGLKGTRSPGGKHKKSNGVQSKQTDLDSVRFTSIIFAIYDLKNPSFCHNFSPFERSPLTPNHPLAQRGSV